jgi:acyl carrier protein
MMKDEIISIVAEFLDVDPSELDETKTLEDLKIDSLDFIEIMFEAEEQFDAPLTTEMMEARDEIANFGDVLRVAEEMILKHRAEEAAKARA